MGAVRILGIDLGGTRCRALLADTGGARHGTGHARGAHPGTDPAAALNAVARAVTAALDGSSAAAVQRVVLGAAGYAALAESPLRTQLAATGLRCPVRVRADCEVAFAAGTPDPDGTVLVAGTGSMAARITGRSMVARAGGHGWLLGDEGSGFWLGRQAIRATLQMLEAGRPGGELACRVLAAVLGSTPPDADPLRSISAVTTWVHREAPAGIAALAPLVCGAARAGDAQAQALLDRAADLLTETALTLWRAGRPLVLAGGLLLDTPIGTLVGARLRAAGASVHPARDTAAGAAWLAALDTGTGVTAAAHARLTGPPG